jgi:hypothetical protein
MISSDRCRRPPHARIRLRDRYGPSDVSSSSSLASFQRKAYIGITKQGKLAAGRSQHFVSHDPFECQVVDRGALDDVINDANE